MNDLPRISQYNTREEMLSLVPKHGVYAEIGVFQGKFSDAITTILQPKQLVLIDLFTGTMGSGDQDGNSFSYVNLDDVYTRLKEYSVRYPALQVLKGDSVSSLATFENDSFDMVYIDGDHSYEGCKRDLEISFEKVRNGGWIMGHDYEMNMNKAHTAYTFGVRQAVDEFCATYRQSIIAKGMDGCVSYGIQLTKVPKSVSLDF